MLPFRQISKPKKFCIAYKHESNKANKMIKFQCRSNNLMVFDILWTVFAHCYELCLDPDHFSPQVRTSRPSIRWLLSIFEQKPWPVSETRPSLARPPRSLTRLVWSGGAEMSSLSPSLLSLIPPPWGSQQCAASWSSASVLVTPSEYQIFSNLSMREDRVLTQRLCQGLLL